MSDTGRDGAGKAGNPVGRLFIITTIMIMLAVASAGFFALGIAQRYMLPELATKAQIVGDAVSDHVNQALHYQIPFDRFVGMDDYLGTYIKTEPDIAYLAVMDSAGNLLYRAGLDNERLWLLMSDESADRKEAATNDTGVIAWITRASLNFAGQVEVPSYVRRGNYYDTAVKLGDAAHPAGTLHVGVSTNFYRDEIREQAFDIGIVLLVAALISFEILLLIVTTTLTGPLQSLLETLQAVGSGLLAPVPVNHRGASEIARLSSSVGEIITDLRVALAAVMEKAERVRARRPDRQAQTMVSKLMDDLMTVIRPPNPRESLSHAQAAIEFVSARLCTFLFVFAEEMIRPFLPIFIKRVAEGSGVRNVELSVGLPLSVFMLTVAVSMPLLAGLCERIGSRKLFMIGAACSTLGILGMALTDQYWVLVATRCLSGLGYGMTFVACQGHVIAFAGPANRASGMAMFVGGITAADIAGPAIGGLIAGRLGFVATLIGAAALALIAGVSASLVLHDRPEALRPRDEKPMRFADMWRVAANGRLLALLALTAVPAKLLLSGALFFLVPLIARSMGAPDAEVGRIVMTYGIASLVLSPLFANLTDRWSAHGAAVGLGGLIAGSGMIPMLFQPSVSTLTLAVIGLGIGQAMSITPQFALALRVCESDVSKYGLAPVVGLYRLIERLGGALGPSIAAVLSLNFGQTQAMAALGVGTAIAAVAFCVTFMVVGVTPDPDQWTSEEEETLRRTKRIGRSA